MVNLYIALHLERNLPSLPNPTINKLEDDLCQQLSLCNCISCITENVFSEISTTPQTFVYNNLVTSLYPSCVLSQVYVC